MLFFFVVFNFFLSGRLQPPPFPRFFRDGHFEGKSDNGPGGSAAPSGAQDVYSIMQKQGTLMAFWGQPKKRAPDVDPEAPTPAKRTALTPAPAAASVGSPLLQAHCASRQ